MRWHAQNSGLSWGAQVLPGTQKMAWAGGASMVLSGLRSCRSTLLGVGTAPQSPLLLQVEEKTGPRWLAATGTAVWPAAATAAKEEEEVAARSSLAFPPPGLGERGRWGGGAVGSKGGGGGQQPGSP